MYRFLCEHKLSFIYRKYPGERIVGWYSESMFNFIRSCQTISQNCCNDLHSNHYWDWPFPYAPPQLDCRLKADLVSSVGFCYWFQRAWWQLYSWNIVSVCSNLSEVTWMTNTKCLSLLCPTWNSLRQKSCEH